MLYNNELDREEIIEGLVELQLLVSNIKSDKEDLRSTAFTELVNYDYTVDSESKIALRKFINRSIREGLAINTHGKITTI